MSDEKLAWGVDPADTGSFVTFTYTNYRGWTGVRRVRPLRIRFGPSEWHPEPQWLLDAYDLDKGADRSFALKDVTGWRAGQ